MLLGQVRGRPQGSLEISTSSSLFPSSNPLFNLFRDVTKDRTTLVLYLVPALLYCVYNNLAFVNLTHFDPTTYFLLLQFRIVITGVLFQVIFKKWLSLVQWLSLIILTMGCVLKQIEFDWNEAPKLDTKKFLSFNILLVILQSCCSCFAGVYNEYLLKKKDALVDIHVQNIYMYLNSILFNFLALFIVDRDPLSAFSSKSISALANYRVMLIMFNSAVIGIITSFFILRFNSIVKGFAGAVELVLTAIVAHFMFGTPLLANTIVAVILVCVALLMYVMFPVRNAASRKRTSSTSQPQSNETRDQELGGGVGGGLRKTLPGEDNRNSHTAAAEVHPRGRDDEEDLDEEGGREIEQSSL